MDFSTVKAIEIPEGTVKQITDAQGNILWKKGGLPSGYTQQTAIKTNGGCAFDTGLYLTNNSKIEIEFYRNSTNNGVLFGAASTGNLASFTGTIAKNATGTARWRFANTGTPQTVKITLARHVAVMDSTGVKIDNTQYSYPEYPGNATAEVTLDICRTHNADGSHGTTYFVGNLYYIKVWENGTLIADFVPAKSPNNVYGMYDIERDAWYPSDTGTNFTNA